MRGGRQENATYRLFEAARLAVFVLGVIMALRVNPSTGQRDAVPTDAEAQIEAYAIAMPHRGWAPLTVYFSAFGSASQAGRIVQYEWDLKANGLYDTDATAQAGYASYRYAGAPRPIAPRVTMTEA